MANILISDFTLEEVPHGGSEVGNQMLIEHLGLDFIKSAEVTEFNKKDFYVICNISLMNPNLVKEIKNYNYIIFECDYKICPSRHPWRFPKSLIPPQFRINYDLYENAKAVFVKTTDHENVYKLNDVKANFINLRTNIWSPKDLELLETINNDTPNKINKSCIYNTDNWIKNTKGSIKYCEENNIPYGFVFNGQDREVFLREMAKYKNLVFFPIARETFCRIVMEAKCMGMEVITNKNYGCTLEDYFNLKGSELINYLRYYNNINLNKMKKYIPQYDNAF